LKDERKTDIEKEKGLRYNLLSCQQHLEEATRKLNKCIGRDKAIEAREA
jgi:hypothetical protein